MTADARASRAAVAMRRADRRARRRELPRPHPSFAVALAVLGGMLLLTRPLVPAAAPEGAMAAVGAADMDLSLRYGGVSGSGPGSTVPTPAPTTAPTPVADPAARAIRDDHIPYLSGYRWPLEHARITQAFGPASDGLFVVGGQRFHDGIDIANFCGAPILAAHDGRVIAAGRHVVAALGWTGDVLAYDAYLMAMHLWGTQARIIVTDDGNGFRSVYVHLHRIDVHTGDVVKAGQQIGLEGSSGHATGCHLHFSIYSPTDVGRWKTNSRDVDRHHLPTGEVARIDPLLLLPPLEAGWITWGWGTQPTD